MIADSCCASQRCHLPFRNWCKVCIAARSKDDAHKEREISEDCQEVHLDYCFLRNKKGEEYASVLVLKDRKSKLMGSHVVPNKGASTEWVVKQSIRDLEKWDIRIRLHYEVTVNLHWWIC